VRAPTHTAPQQQEHSPSHRLNNRHSLCRSHYHIHSGVEHIRAHSVTRIIVVSADRVSGVPRMVFTLRTACTAHARVSCMSGGGSIQLHLCRGVHRAAANGMLRTESVIKSSGYFAGCEASLGAELGAGSYTYWPNPRSTRPPWQWKWRWIAAMWVVNLRSGCSNHARTLVWSVAGLLTGCRRGVAGPCVGTARNE
jgi:hypothetical protein